MTRIVLIDSFSTDATAAIAEKHGAEVLKHPFKNHADQFRWGLEAARPTTEWVLRLDCDEYFEGARSLRSRACCRALRPT